MISNSFISRKFFTAVFAAVCLFCPLSLTAAEYTVGGGSSGPNYYATLEDLCWAHWYNTYNGGGTIILNGDDSSLTVPFGGYVIIKGQGVISPGASGIPFFTGWDGNLTIDSDSLEFRNFNSHYGVICAYGDTTVTIAGGTNTFSGNDSGGVIYIYGDYGDVAISGGTNTFSDNSASSYGGAIYCLGNITISGGTNTFSDNSAGSYSSWGGAIYSSGNITISGGTNKFSSNSANPQSNNAMGGAIYSSGNITISDGTNEFSDNTAGYLGGAIYSKYGNITISGGTNTFLDNSTGAGGAVYGYDVSITNGENTFSGNFAGVGGAIYSSGNITISGGTNTFSDNLAAGSGGGAIEGGLITISGGTNVFSGNSANYGGGAIEGGLITISDGTSTFTGNTAGENGGAISGNYITISGGTNMFSGNSASYGGGAISGNYITISGGTNTFTGNTAGESGGAISGGNLYYYGRGDITISGGTNTFTGNTADRNGGAIAGNNITIIGGINTFTGNTAGESGGAIYSYAGDVTLRATDGDFTFRGNNVRVEYWDGEDWDEIQCANAIYMNNRNNDGILTLAAEEGQSIFFYDPIRSYYYYSNLTVAINNQATDTGTVVFDGSDYTREYEYYSTVYGITTVGYGTLALKGNVMYGGLFEESIGSFTLNDAATLTSDEAMNQIWANTITLNGTVDIVVGGTLTLRLAAANSVNFNGTLNVGLGFETSGLLSVVCNIFTPLPGDLTFGEGAMLNVYWDDSLLAATNGWSFDYHFFDAANIYGLENLSIVVYGFENHQGFRWSANDGILTISFSEVPEPATLVILGLAAVGLPMVRRLRRG